MITPPELDTRGIIQSLNELEDTLKNKALKSGVDAVASAGVGYMKGNTPVLSGDVRQSQGRRKLSQRERLGIGVPDGTLAVLVGSTRKVRGRYRSRIANILDGGAKAHWIEAGKSSAKLDFMYAQGMRKKMTVLGNAASAARSAGIGKTGYFGPKVWHKVTPPSQFVQASDSDLSGVAENLFYSAIARFLNRNRA